jgi:hypothetical protein
MINKHRGAKFCEYWRPTLGKTRAFEEEKVEVEGNQRRFLMASCVGRFNWLQ